MSEYDGFAQLARRFVIVGIVLAVVITIGVLLGGFVLCRLTC